MRGFASLVLVAFAVSLASAGSIEIGQSTTLANLISGVDTIEYPELAFTDWGSFGGLGITPENTTVTKRDDLLLEFSSPSPGFSLFGYSGDPASGLEISSVSLLDSSSGFDGLASLGDTSQTLAGDTNVFADFNKDLLAGFNSTTGGTIGHQWHVRPVVAIPEGGFVASGMLAGWIAMLFRRRR